MKKHLLTTSAIALGVAAAPAAAQEWDVNVGGHFQSHVVYSTAGGPANAAADFDGLNVRTDAEIDFAPSITLDNGLTFSALVELEGQEADGGQIDHTFMTISGDTLGTIQIGNLNSVTYNNSFQTPGVGSIGIDSGTMSGFFPLLGFPTAHPDLSGDSMKINYVTPSFNGFTVGLSYTPNDGGNSVNTGAIDRNADGGLNDIYGISASYNQSMGSVDVGLNAFYQQGDQNARAAVAAVTEPDTSVVLEEAVTALNAADPSNWGVGVNLGFDAFTVGMNYAETDSDQGTAFDQSQHWALGATYNTGVWTVGIDMVNQNDEQSGGDIEQTAYRIGASRDLGPGVAWDVFAISYDGNDKSDRGNDVDGQLIGTAITLNF